MTLRVTSPLSSMLFPVAAMEMKAFDSVLYYLWYVLRFPKAVSQGQS